MEKIMIPPLDSNAAEVIKNNWAKMDKPLHSLGKLEEMVEKYAAMTGTALPDKIKSAMLLMCGDHGIAKYGVSAYPQEVTMQMINGYMRETAGANVMARHAGADVFVIDAGTAFDLSAMPKVHQEKVAWGTEDFTQGPAMTVEQAEKALKVGMKVADECIDKGYNLLVTAEMGIGINDERMAIKRKVVADGLAKNQPRLGDAMDILCKVGGYDHAGLAGMILAGARRRIPTMVDGVNATAAALLAYGLEPACADYMLCSHLSAEISHAKMLEVLRLTPIVDAGMRLGEGTGASLAIVILQMAINTYKELYKRGGMHA